MEPNETAYPIILQSSGPSVPSRDATWPDPRIAALQAENEKLRELLGECDWLLKWANKDLMAFSNMRLETEFFSRREHAIERIQAALEPKP